MCEIKNDSISWIGAPQKNSMVRAAPGGHVGIRGLLPQMVLKLEVLVWAVSGGHVEKPKAYAVDVSYSLCYRRRLC